MQALWLSDEGNMLRAYHEHTDRLAAQVELGGAGERRWVPFPGGGQIWLFASDGAVSRVDPMTTVLSTLGPIGGLGLPQYAHGRMWVWQQDRIWRIDPSGEASSTPLGPEFRPGPAGGPLYAAVTERWLFFGCGTTLIRVDPATSSVTACPLPEAMVLAGLAGGDAGLVLAGGHNRPDIVVLDPETLEAGPATRVPDGGHIVNLHRAGREVWAISSGGMAMRAGGDAATVKLDNGQQHFAAAGTEDSLWVVDEIGCRLVRVSLSQARIVARLDIPDAYWDDPYFRVYPGERSVWLLSRIDHGLDDVFRIDAATDRMACAGLPVRTSSGYAVVAASPESGAVVGAGF